jgi:hypothetical protein
VTVVRDCIHGQDSNVATFIPRDPAKNHQIAENKTVTNLFLLVTDLLLQLGIQFQYQSQVSPTAQTSSIPFPFYLISSESADPWSPF